MKRWIKPVFEIVGFVGWTFSASYFFHQKAPLALAGVGMYLFCNTTRAWVDWKAMAWRKSPKDSAIREILRFFTIEMFGENASFRSTVLMPDPKNHYLYSAHRYQYGSLPGKWSSKAKFPRGAAIAGFAWEDTTTLIKWDLGPFATDGEFREYCEKTLFMPRDLISNLSSRTRKIRTIFFSALVNHRDEFIGVLSVDSTQPGVFQNVPEEKLKKFIAALEATLEEV
jgi:hypothetical protein